MTSQAESSDKEHRSTLYRSASINRHQLLNASLDTSENPQQPLASGPVMEYRSDDFPLSEEPFQSIFLPPFTLEEPEIPCKEEVVPDPSYLAVYNNQLEPYHFEGRPVPQRIKSDQDLKRRRSRKTNLPLRPSSMNNIHKMPPNGGGNDNPRPRKGKKGQFVHVCTIQDCQKTYSRAEHLRRHQARHNGSDLIVCNHKNCRQKYDRTETYDRHCIEDHNLTVPGVPFSRTRAYSMTSSSHESTTPFPTPSPSPVQSPLASGFGTRDLGFPPQGHREHRGSLAVPPDYHRSASSLPTSPRSPTSPHSTWQDLSGFSQTPGRGRANSISSMRSSHPTSYPRQPYAPHLGQDPTTSPVNPRMSPWPTSPLSNLGLQQEMHDPASPIFSGRNPIPPSMMQPSFGHSHLSGPGPSQPLNSVRGAHASAGLGGTVGNMRPSFPTGPDMSFDFNTLPPNNFAGLQQNPGLATNWQPNSIAQSPLTRQPPMRPPLDMSFTQQGPDTAISQFQNPQAYNRASHDFQPLPTNNGNQQGFIYPDQSSQVGPSLGREPGYEGGLPRNPSARGSGNRVGRGDGRQRHGRR